MPPVCLKKLNRLFHNFKKLPEDRLLIIAMTAAIKQPGATSHETPILFSPFNDFDVLSLSRHDNPLESWQGLPALANRKLPHP